MSDSETNRPAAESTQEDDAAREQLRLHNDRKLRRKNERKAARPAVAGALRERIATLITQAGLLQSFAAEPLILVDVGARGGLPQEWEQAIPILRSIAFEPDRKVAATYVEAEHRVDFVPKAVAGSAGVRPFYRTRSRYMASLLKPDAAVTRLFGLDQSCQVERVDQVETTTIDDVVRENHLAFVDAIKLDTQGSELDTLTGAEHTVTNLVFGIETEVEFVPLYENQPLFADIDMHLRAREFELQALMTLRYLTRVGVRGLEDVGAHNTMGTLTTADALYFRSTPSVVRVLMGLEPAARERYLAGAVIVCLVYRRPDFAVHLLEAAESTIDAGVTGALLDSIREYQRTMMDVSGDISLKRKA